jgi:hypothetical protein
LSRSQRFNSGPACLRPNSRVLLPKRPSTASAEKHSCLPRLDPRGYSLLTSKKTYGGQSIGCLALSVIFFRFFFNLVGSDLENTNGVTDNVDWALLALGATWAWSVILRGTPRTFCIVDAHYHTCHVGNEAAELFFDVGPLYARFVGCFPTV